MFHFVIRPQAAFSRCPRNAWEGSRLLGDELQLGTVDEVHH